MKPWLIVFTFTLFVFDSVASKAQVNKDKFYHDFDSVKHDTSSSYKKRIWHKRQTYRPLTGDFGLYPWEGAPGIKAGIIYDGSIFGELGIIKTDIPPACDLYGFEDIALTSEFNFNFRHFIIGPKFSYEYNLSLCGFKGSFIYYSDFKDKDLRVLPEIGVGIYGVIMLYYGYAIPLQKFEFGAIGRNSLSLTVNVPLFWTLVGP